MASVLHESQEAGRDHSLTSPCMVTLPCSEPSADEAGPPITGLCGHCTSDLTQSAGKALASASDRCCTGLRGVCRRSGRLWSATGARTTAAGPSVGPDGNGGQDVLV